MPPPDVNLVIEQQAGRYCRALNDGTTVTQAVELIRKHTWNQRAYIEFDRGVVLQRKADEACENESDTSNQEITPPPRKRRKP